MKSPSKIVRWVRRRYLALCKRCDLPFSLYSVSNAKEVYHQRTGLEISYANPVTYNEKLFWLARYWQNPLIVKCSDKVAVREYVRSCGLPFLLNELFAVYDDPYAIAWDSLPDKFVLKCNHGCAFNIICKDKSQLDIAKSVNCLDAWMNTRYGRSSAEYQYLYIKPKVLAERFIDGGDAGKFEIQFFCFNGKARHILLRNDLGDVSANSFAVTYDMDWNREYARIDEDSSVSISRPSNLDELILYAEKLAKPFPQVRVDFYLVGDRVYFGELTFSTCGNVMANYRKEKLALWAQELVLPPKSPERWKDLQ